MASRGSDAGPRARSQRDGGPFRASFRSSFAAAVAVAGFTLVHAAGCGTVTSSSGVLPVGGSDAGVGGGGFVELSGDGSACQAGAVENYTPGIYQSATGAWQGVCVGDGQDLIGQYYDACFGDSATSAACGAFKTMSAASAACSACILTPVTAARLGPIIDYGGFVGKNTAGCIELADPGGLPCATAVQALTGCELQACQANCPVTSSASLDAYYDCARYADGTGCASYSAMAACGQMLDGGPASICASAAFKDFYDAVVPLFCGQRATLTIDGATVYPPFTDAAPDGGPASAFEDGAALFASDAAAGDASGVDGGAGTD